MSICTSSLRTIGIVLLKNIFSMGKKRLDQNHEEWHPTYRSWNIIEIIKVHNLFMCIYVMFLIFNLTIVFILPYLIIINVVISFLIHQGCHHEGIDNGLPQEMKCYPIHFMRYSYHEELKKSSFFWYNAYQEECDRNVVENDRW